MTAAPVLQEYAASLARPTLGGDTAAYDEVVRPDGSLRPAWQGLAQVAVRLTDDDLRRADDDIRRFLANDGVTYARPGEDPGPWRLDPLPLVIGADDWAGLETGLAQRAELLNAMMTDLYGPQRLLAEGVVPPAVVYGHPGYLRRMARASMRDPRPLVLTATDLGRDATGRWRVLADRVQAPSGLGYAMENRRVMSRVLPELYREAVLHRMGPFFSALRSALLQAADEEVADPQVVVLSPGTHSETAYDQAFIASNLGFPLVQGSDLTVRGGRVWLRGMGGLEPVHVVLRRVDASWSDPLELRAESQLGVAGLAEAVRRGTVRVVNGLGAKVLESPALTPYLEAACALLLSEPLRLPSRRTWWCGDPEGAARVLEHPEELVVRAVDDATPLTGTDEEIRRRVRAAPYRFVGQERPVHSRAPAFDGRTVTSAPVTVRTFALRYGSAYRPLLGGLAFGDALAADLGPAPTKDVWVLKAQAADSDQGLGEVRPLTGHQTLTPAVPRALEHLYWMGRYAERAETLLRLVLAIHPHADDFQGRPRTAGGRGLQVLVDSAARLAGPPQRAGDLDPWFRSLLTDRGRVGSVAQALDAAREAAEGVRDQLSGDVWRAFAIVDRAEGELARTQRSHQTADTAGRMLSGCLALYGVTDNMVRDPGWHLLEVGRALERALQLSLLLRATTTRHGFEVDKMVLAAVLTASESSVTHQRRFRGAVRPATVLDLLLEDETNPRSLDFALATARQHLAALPTSTGSTRPERLLDDLREHLDDLDVTTLVTIGGDTRPNLARYLDGLHEHLTRIGEAVSDVHLAGGPAPRAFGVGRRLR